MSKMMILELPVSSIDVPEDRARDYDEGWAQMLAVVIAVQGLHHPIRVRQNGDRYTLISGRHRLQAFELNQSASIPATVSTAETDDDARMEEVMENLARNELTALDRCHHLYELKVVWDRMHPDFANGGGNQRGRNGGTSCSTEMDAPEVFGFASSVADQVGLSKQKINMAIKIWAGLTPASRRTLRGTKVATKQTELKALSELSPVRQEKVLDLILGDDHPDISNVAGALAFLGDGVQVAPLEKRYRVVSEGIKALPDESFDRLVLENQERLIVSLRRQGRI